MAKAESPLEPPLRNVRPKKGPAGRPKRGTAAGPANYPEAPSSPKRVRSKRALGARGTPQAFSDEPLPEEPYDEPQDDTQPNARDLREPDEEQKTEAGEEQGGPEEETGAGEAPGEAEEAARSRPDVGDAVQEQLEDELQRRGRQWLIAAIGPEVIIIALILIAIMILFAIIAKPATGTPVPSGGGATDIAGIAQKEFEKNVEEEQHDGRQSCDCGDNPEQHQGDQISEYTRAFGLEHHQWCVMFAHWVYTKAGKQFPLIAESTILSRWLKNNAQWVAWKRDSAERPQVGDIMIYDWNHDGNYDHTNLTVAVSGNTITTIGGNETNSVRKSDWDITGSSSNARGLVGWGRT